jgi:hypothetical protein
MADMSPSTGFTGQTTEWDFLATLATGGAPDLSFYLWIAGQSEFQKRCTKESAQNLLKCIADLVDRNDANKLKVLYDKSSQVHEVVR